MRTLLGLFFLSWLALAPSAQAQIDAYYTPGEPVPEDEPEFLLNSMNINCMTGYTDIQYRNAKLLPPEPAIHWAVSAYLPIYKPLAQTAIGAETGAYSAISIRLRDQFHIAVPVFASLKYGAGAYADSRRWLGFGGGFGLDSHWTFQNQERVGQEFALTAFAELTIYQHRSTGMSLRYQTSLLSAYFQKQVFSLNMFLHLPF